MLLASLLLAHMAFAATTNNAPPAAIPIQYGYPGPAYPRRGYHDYGGFGPPRRFPQPHYGPQMEPCIYHGDCRGPRYWNEGPPRMPPGPPPPDFDDGE